MVAWNATLSPEGEVHFEIIRDYEQTFVEGCEQTSDGIEGLTVVGHFNTGSLIREFLDRTVEKRWKMGPACSLR